MSDKSERLVNLTIALLETRRPLTLAEIRSRTGYYDQGDAESARRMFERDKEDLRQLGVPVETRGVDAFDAEVGYIIDRDAYELPDVALDAAEVTALALAIQVAGDRQSRLALGKIAARAPDPTDGAAPIAARIDVEAAVIDDVAEALVQRRVVRFPYSPSEGEPGLRTIDPYAVVRRRGSWYLVGRDHDRDALRAFRFDRVTGHIRTLGEVDAFAVPDDFDPVESVGGSDEVEARIAVAPMATWDAGLIGGERTGDVEDGWPVYRFESRSPWQIAAWALGLGEQAEVLAPPWLRDHVRGRLQQIAGTAR